MIDHIIASLVLIVLILLVIIAFLTVYIIYERRKTTILPLNKFVPLLTYDKSSGDHSNSATNKRMTKRLRQRVRPLFIRTQNSQGFLLSNGDLTSHKLIQQTTNSTIDHTTIHFDY